MKLVKESISNKDVMITLPSNISWEDYQKELNAVKDGREVMNFKVPFLPKNSSVGSKCYLVYKGNIVGYQFISGFSNDGFTCTTTGKKWDGKFIQRTGPFYPIKPIPQKGFQGFRYVN